MRLHLHFCTMRPRLLHIGFSLKKFAGVDSTPKCNSQGPRALAVDGLRDQGER